eukprot:g31433.t1
MTTNNLSWSTHIGAMVKKTQHRLYFLRKQRKFGIRNIVFLALFYYPNALCEIWSACTARKTELFTVPRIFKAKVIRFLIRNGIEGKRQQNGVEDYQTDHEWWSRVDGAEWRSRVDGLNGPLLRPCLMVF